MDKNQQQDNRTDPVAQARDSREDRQPEAPPVEIGGRDGPEPTRYGDWEKAGRCVDF